MALRSTLGHALYRLPGGVKRALPGTLRDAFRHRFGPFAPWEAGYRELSHPENSGHVVGPPDFVGIGAQKCGTTWWYDLIVAHPEVFHRAGVHKERHFFARFATDPFGPDEVRAYHAWFSRPQGRLSGEWTPDYLFQPWVPSLLSTAAPDSRLLAILRDPVERFLSGVAHSEIEPSSNLGSVLAEAFHRGTYARALRNWLAYFHPDRLLVLQYERCTSDPQGELARTYRFLGLDETFRPAAIGAPLNVTTKTKTDLDSGARERLVELYAEDVKDVAGLVPDLDVGLWPNFSNI